MTNATTSKTVTVGDTVEILPAYQMATKRADRRDEWTGLRGEVLRFGGIDALLALEGSGTEVWIPVIRLEGR